MKVKISKYSNWIGPYQVLNWFTPIFGKKRIEKFEDSKLFEKISDKTLPFFQWIEDNFKKRRINVQIDKWDTWSMDHTLALIILPMLKQLQSSKHGSPSIEDADVPEHLRSSKAPKHSQNDTDAFWHKRWEWVLAEMIWAFTQIQDDDWEAQYHSKRTHTAAKALSEATDNELYDIVKEAAEDETFDREGYQAHNERIQRGTALFGKYYRGLWD